MLSTNCFFLLLFRFIKTANVKKRINCCILSALLFQVMVLVFCVFFVFVFCCCCCFGVMLVNKCGSSSA
jgi:hypothetical protein